MNRQRVATRMCFAALCICTYSSVAAAAVAVLGSQPAQANLKRLAIVLNMLPHLDGLQNTCSGFSCTGNRMRTGFSNSDAVAAAQAGPELSQSQAGLGSSWLMPYFGSA